MLKNLLLIFLPNSAISFHPSQNPHLLPPTLPSSSLPACLQFLVQHYLLNGRTLSLAVQVEDTRSATNCNRSHGVSLRWTVPPLVSHAPAPAHAHPSPIRNLAFSQSNINGVYIPSFLLIIGVAIVKRDWVPYAAAFAAIVGGYKILTGGGGESSFVELWWRWFDRINSPKKVLGKSSSPTSSNSSL